uniref:ATPase AAA-type core domain-containing protein n=1 Tax=Panagrolaimus davidi TaxID=227884 RepID=A0A914PIA1_9BILA
MARRNLKKALKLSPNQTAAKPIIRKVIKKKKVEFCKIIHKKNITPLSDKIQGERRLEGCFDGGDPALSFSELTDSSMLNNNTPPRKTFSNVVERRSIGVPAKKSELQSFFSQISEKRFKRLIPADELDEFGCYKRPASPIQSFEEQTASATSEEEIVIDRAPTSSKLWSDEFAPMKEKDIIHGPSLDIFKEWLRCWKKLLTSRAKAENESEDFDYELEVETEGLCCTFVLSGPTGCGKTSFVHFLAKQFGFNVIELSASDERSYKTMKDKLQGAMENFGVQPGGDIRSMFGDPKKDALKYNLVLIDDVSAF